MFLKKVRNMLHKFLFLIPLVISISSLAVLVQKEKTDWDVQANTLVDPAEEWADSVLLTMTEEEKIGQLFMVAAYSNRDEYHYQEIEDLIEYYHIGGLIFFQGGPVRQAHLTNRYQAKSTIPLMIGIDAEWGLGMRLDSTLSFPRQMTLGALQDDSLIYEMGVAVAKHCKRLGIHVNFAPVVDVNNNPNNPVIGSRSFGEDKEKVAQKGIMYMKGMQDAGILTTAKHFPGHGDTDKDSHYTLPMISHDKNRLQDIELYPFQQLFDAGATGVMVAHLNVPALDFSEYKTTTLSPDIITDLLKTSMGFKGLVFTDAMSMKGLTNNFVPGEADLLALQAGNDVLLFPQDVPKAVSVIQQALKKKVISWDLIDEKVKKILTYKYKVDLNEYKPIPIENLHNDLQDFSAISLRLKLLKESITLARDDFQVLPFGRPDTLKIGVLNIGEFDGEVFNNAIKQYGNFDTYFVDNVFFNGVVQVTTLAKNYDYLIVNILDLNPSYYKNYGLNQGVIDFVNRLTEETQLVLNVYGSPYILQNFPDVPTIICAYEDEPETRGAVPDILFGQQFTKGKLPVSVSSLLPEGAGVITEPKVPRMPEIAPELVGMGSNTLSLMDNMVESAIAQEYFPGCQIVVARHGKIIWNKAYGHFTYDQNIPVTTESIYDVASVSKVTGTLQAVMMLVERGDLELQAKVGEYLPDVANSNKSDITIEDVLTHQAGLTPWIPHWKYTYDENDNLSSYYYLNGANRNYPNQVGDDLFSRVDMEEIMWQKTLASDRIASNADGTYNYTYSDLSFYIMKRLVEVIANEPMEIFLKRELYDPMGLPTFGYNPIERFSKDRIVPTEVDDYFRNQLIHGYVHDQGAALLGGVGGHAGVFTTAYELAHVMQLQLQKGEFGGKRYFKEGTIELFTKKYFSLSDNRRALGWDRPEAQGISYFPAESLAPNGYGHSGFTGCVVWADPDKDLVFVFLSNRVYPTAENKKMIIAHTRRKLIELVYSSILF